MTFLKRRSIYPAILLLLAPAFARAADVMPHGILAHGNDSQFWIARIEPLGTQGEQTSIYHRVLGQGDHWQLLTRVQARVAAIASQESVAGLLMDDGSWALMYSDGGVVTAGRLPGESRMIALAGGAKSWWAIGQTPGGIAALRSVATRPAPAPERRTAGIPARASSRPAESHPVETRAVLFRLVGNNWTAVNELPFPLGDPPYVELGVYDQTPCVAVWTGSVLTVRRLDNGRWTPLLERRDLSHPAAFKLIGSVIPPRLWVENVDGPDLFYVLDSHNQKPFELQPIPDCPPTDRTLTAATGGIRMIADVRGSIVERDFSTDTLQPEGPQHPVPLPGASIIVDLQGMQTLIAVASLMLVILGWFRRQTVGPELPKDLSELRPAPHGRRLAAGLIDAAPVILVVATMSVRYQNLPAALQQARQVRMLIAYWAAGLFYVLYMTLIEAVAGRSLGKVMLGLRVVGLDGAPASPGALVTRNALRIFDVSLLFMPVLSVLLFPLRQRAADLAAGTLVTVDPPPAEPPPENPAPPPAEPPPA